MTNSNTSAYPSTFSSGLSKREYFAALAMQGILRDTNTAPHYSDESVAKSAVEMADALIAALNKMPEGEISNA
jgi:hypothetical protein